jgi:hypothetical protein
MYYLLTSPFKVVKKKRNQWYILFKVLGGCFDDAMESLYSAREQTMVTTCDPAMLPVHAQERKMSRYQDETDENFRARIANYQEILRLGGTDAGILLAVQTLGFTDVSVVTAKTFTGDKTRWAEFYVVLNLDPDQPHPASTQTLKEQVRKTKQVGAKDNYMYRYVFQIFKAHTARDHIGFWLYLYYYTYLKLDGQWQLDGEHMLDSVIVSNKTRWNTRYSVFYNKPKNRIRTGPYDCGAVKNNEETELRENFYLNADYFDYLKLDGSWYLDGTQVMDAQRVHYELRIE